MQRHEELYADFFFFNWSYRCNIYQPQPQPYLSFKRGIPVTLQSYLKCIETKHNWWRSFGESKIYLMFLLLTIFSYNKYIYYGKKGTYICSMMAHLHSCATMWLKVCTTPLYQYRLKITRICRAKLRMASAVLVRWYEGRYIVRRPGGIAEWNERPSLALVDRGIRTYEFESNQ